MRTEQSEGISSAVLGAEVWDRITRVHTFGAAEKSADHVSTLARRPPQRIHVSRRVAKPAYIRASRHGGSVM